MRWRSGWRASSAPRACPAGTNFRQLNAGIALVCLGAYLEDGLISEEQFKRISVLANKCYNTSVAKESETHDVEYIEQSITMIEEYLKEQGV